MFNTKDIVKSKKFPTFIKNAAAIKKQQNVDKVFPKLGLKNNAQSVKIDDINDKSSISSSLKYRIENHIQNIKDDLDYYNVGTKTFAKEAVITYLLEQINKSFPKSKYLKTSKSKTIKLQKSIKNVDGKVIYKKGKNIITILAELNAELKKAKANTIRGLNGMINFANPKYKKKFKVVFSSEGLNGLWDLATMSMRGIESCQSWNGGYAPALIGTLVDPYAGIIYITDGTETDHGPKMIARSVVRVVVNKKTNTPHLFLERVYVSSQDNEDDDYGDYDDNEPDSDCYMNAFKAYLEKKVNNKMTVICANRYGQTNTSTYYIPNSKTVTDLVDTQKSYRDSRLQYEEPSNAVKLKAKFIQ